MEEKWLIPYDSNEIENMVGYEKLWHFIKTTREQVKSDEAHIAYLFYKLKQYKNSTVNEFNDLWNKLLKEYQDICDFYEYNSEEEFSESQYEEFYNYLILKGEELYNICLFDGVEGVRRYIKDNNINCDDITFIGDEITSLLYDICDND